MDPKNLFYRRYELATLLEDGRDMVFTDGLAASLILNDAVRGMLEYAFLSRDRHVPRRKDLVSASLHLDRSLWEQAQAYYRAADAAQRLACAEHLADLTIQAQGFFEWDGGIEDL